jgi:hypothetical protein
MEKKDMTTDQKIDDALKVVREQGEQLLLLIQEQGEKSEGRDKELRGLILEERSLNNSRFTQLATGLMDLKKDVDAGFTAVNAKIDQVRESLSADINAFGEELYETKRRVTRLEKKPLS